MSSPITSLLTVKVMVLASMSPETSIPRDDVLPVSDWTAKTAPGSPVPLMATSHAHASSIRAFAPSSISVEP